MRIDGHVMVKLWQLGNVCITRTYILPSVRSNVIFTQGQQGQLSMPISLRRLCHEIHFLGCMRTASSHYSVERNTIEKVKKKIHLWKQEVQVCFAKTKLCLRRENKENKNKYQCIMKWQDIRKYACTTKSTTTKNVIHGAFGYSLLIEFSNSAGPVLL